MWVILCHQLIINEYTVFLLSQGLGSHRSNCWLAAIARRNGDSSECQACSIFAERIDSSDFSIPNMPTCHQSSYLLPYIAVSAPIMAEDSNVQSPPTCFPEFDPMQTAKRGDLVTIFEVYIACHCDTSIHLDAFEGLGIE